MIDNTAQVERLIERMQAELPLAARMTPELIATLANQSKPGNKAQKLKAQKRP